MQQDINITNIANAIANAVPAEKIYLFGSRAYGTPREDSDYDFYVVIKDDSMHPVDAAMEARLTLPRGRDFCVDILANYSNVFNSRRATNTLERKIFNEGVVVYERPSAS